MQNERLSRVLILFAAACGLLCAQGTVEASRRSAYPEVWPAGPRRDSVPEWARPGRVRFARWDGGPIETAKAMLSGWPGFNPPIPDYIYTMTNWYDPETIGLLREAGLNVIWVTFSNGFSNQTERFQQELLRRYIAECHRHGIHVMAYESIANMFWEDMHPHVPESRNWAALGADGKPVPYGAAQYKAMGRVTRYMADLSNPGWRAYLRSRIELALDAGADGVMYDNNFGNGLLEVYRDIYQYGAARKRDFLLMGNFHSSTYAFNRLVNAVTTEDGVEPGIYADGRMVNNIGLHRIHSALSEGWKPVMIEHGRREAEGADAGNTRLRQPMSPRRTQLAMAESMMFSIGTEIFVEGGFAHGLRTRTPEAMAVWKAIGRYNAFFADSEEFYTGARSLASLAVILDDRSAGVPLLNALAERGVVYDVLYANDLTPERLAPYPAVAVLTAESIPDGAATALNAYRGKLFAAGKAASLLGARTAVRWEQLPAEDTVASALRAADPSPAVRIEAAPGILFSVAAQPAKGRTLVHLLNYTLRPSGNVKLITRERFTAVRLLSPDGRREPPRRISATEFEVAAPEVYSLLVFENKP